MEAKTKRKKRKENLKLKEEKKKWKEKIDNVKAIFRISSYLGEDGKHIFESLLCGCM